MNKHLIICTTRYCLDGSLYKAEYAWENSNFTLLPPDVSSNINCVTAP